MGERIWPDDYADEIVAADLNAEILDRMQHTYRAGDVLDGDDERLISHLPSRDPLRDWVEVRPGGVSDDHHYVWLDLAGRDLVVRQREVLEAEQALTEAREARRLAVENAARVGLTPYRIAQITGLSQPGVAKILSRG